MSHLTRIRADLDGGANPWVLGKAVLQAELQAFDDAQFKSVNGDAGGTWAPSSQIIIGGQGVNLTGSAIVSNCTAFTIAAGDEFDAVAGSLVSINNTLTVASGGEWTGRFQLNVATSALIQVDSGATLVVAGSSIWTMNGFVTGTFTYSATTTATNSTLTAASGSSFGLVSGALLQATVDSTVTHNGPVTFASTSTVFHECLENPNGAHATIAWRLGTIPTSSHSFDCSSDIYIAASVASVAVTHTLLDATATVPPVDGSKLRFLVPTGGTHSVTFVREDGSVVATIANPNLTGVRVTFLYRNSAWHTLTWFDT